MRYVIIFFDMALREGQGPGSEGDYDLYIESPGVPPPRTPLGFAEGPIRTGAFVRPDTDAALRMAMLVQSGRQEAADEIYRELTGREPPPPVIRESLDR